MKHNRYSRCILIFIIFFGITSPHAAIRFFGHLMTHNSPGPGHLLLYARPMMEETTAGPMHVLSPEEFALALAATMEDTLPEPGELPKIPEVSIRSFSGAPLLLEITVSDPAGLVSAVTLESDVSSFTYRLSHPAPDDAPADAEETRTPAHTGTIDIKLTPFLKPGVYDLTVILETSVGNLGRSFRVGFVDYVWGRDNFRYPNLGLPPESFRSYSELLFAWGEERFGSLSEREKVVMLYELYRMFGDRTGRCYAFSGSQVRYKIYPDLLPSYYRTVYDIRQGNRAIQIEMDFYQKDIVFHHFVQTGTDPYAEQSLDSLKKELDKILEGIQKQTPVVVGYLGGEEHHSMVVYGFIQDRDTGRTVLINANNWQEEADVNLFSKDVENISFDLSPDTGDDKGLLMEWLGRDGRVRGEVERIFAVDIQKEYSHPREVLEEFIQAFCNELQQENESILVLEHAENIYLEDDGGKRSGFYQRRRIQDIAGVDFRKIENNYIIRFPADQRYTLYIKAPDSDESRDSEEKQHLPLFLVTPGAEGFTVTIQDDFMLPRGGSLTGIMEKEDKHGFIRHGHSR